MSPENGSGDPLYLRIARSLKTEIISGVFPVGTQLPTEEDLCRRFNVSRYTVRSALGRLRDDGLISSRRGAGTTVIPPPTMGMRSFGAMSIEDLLHAGSGSSLTIGHIGMLTLDKATAQRTGLKAGEEWLFVEALGFNTGSDIPLGHAQHYINKDFAGVSRLLTTHKAPIFPLIEDLFGVTMAEVTQEISARLAAGNLARQLMVEPGSPALEVRHSYRLSSGKIAQLTINSHPADRYKHAVTMRRLKG
ncbi:GntR family transcriptional regulator [Sandaracinobacteroides hominis]|uniref:GntR family transcriptional regulator n=1 Tax=Sandaracinobacteroides hominis TaxID=2780086 RepID=UPI0018F4E46A|nr:GntR family transcriptional regulator [Sandaracinobacteroides hominis]